MICAQGTDICETCIGFAGDTQINIPGPEKHRSEYFRAQNTSTEDSNYQDQTDNYNQKTEDRHNSATNNYHTADQNYRGYSPPPKREFRSQAKESRLQFIWDLSPIAKAVIGVVIFSVGFAFVLRSFLYMDLSIVKTPKNGESIKDTEEIVPWFSSWFRTYPTGEEIFDEFEKVTYSEGNKTISETFQLQGTGYFLSPHFSEAKWGKALKERKIQNRDEFNKDYFDQLKIKPTNYDFSGSHIKLWDFDMTFNMVLKKPDKTVFSMNLTHRNKEYKIPDTKIVAGNYGNKGWAVTKGAKTNGNQTITDKDKFSFGFGVNPKGISMSFPKSMFEKFEFKGEQEIFGRRQYKVEVFGLNKSNEVYFDQETGLATKIIGQDVTMYIINYSLYHDALFPSKIIYIPANGKPPLLMEITSLDMGLPLADKLFLDSTYAN